MKQRVRWLGATVIAVASVCALSAVGRLWLGVSRGEIVVYTVFTAVFVTAALAVYLAPLWRPRLRTFGQHVAGTLRSTQWRVGTVISLTLMMLSVLLWTRSHWAVDTLRVPVRRSRFVEACSRLGVVSVGFYLDTYWRSAGERAFRSQGVNGYILTTEQMQVLLEFAILEEKIADSPVKPVRSFACAKRTIRLGARTLKATYVSFPHWVPVILLAIAPALVVFRGFQRWRFGQANECPNCGYNLTGNVSGRCSECGLDLGTRPADDSLSAGCDS